MSFRRNGSGAITDRRKGTGHPQPSQRSASSARARPRHLILPSLCSCSYGGPRDAIQSPGDPRHAVGLQLAAESSLRVLCRSTPRLREGEASLITSRSQRVISSRIAHRYARRATVHRIGALGGATPAADSILQSTRATEMKQLDTEGKTLALSASS